ncbi:glial fibrillary acidic protein-like [Mobula hypostoma]|uniref:glial fibrillary acidic protein-like n=1 Tax=Mobula hypostoma TaxID=723540 RepID=UPI002FC3C515
MHQSCQRAVATYPDRTGEQLEKELHDGLEEGKERFKDLNDRFAKYINSTVLCLLRRNKELLAELSNAEKDQPGRSEAIFQKARNDLKCRLEEQQKELNCLKADKEKYKKRLEKEIQLRKEAEKDYEDLRKKTDETNVALDKLQRKVKLTEIQLSWKKYVISDAMLFQFNELCYPAPYLFNSGLVKGQFTFEEASTRALENAKNELECYRKEMNELKLKDELMKNSLLEKDKDIFRQTECGKVLEKRIVRHTNEYQKLLNIKTQLEREIVTYKNLLGQVERKARDYSSQPAIIKKEARDPNDICLISSSDEDRESEDNEDLRALDQD